MNTAPHLDAAITALTVLADYLHPGWTADPDRLLTAAEMGCAHAGLPQSQAPAVTTIASFWIALATGCPPARPGRDDAADRNLAGLPGYAWEQAAALRLAARMLRDWLVSLATAAAPQPAGPDDLDGDLDYDDDLEVDGPAWTGPDRFTVIPAGPDIPRYVLLICGFLNAHASRPARRRLLHKCGSRRQRRGTRPPAPPASLTA